MTIGFFQNRIEEIINNVISSDETLSAEQLDHISSQLALYFSTVLLTMTAILLLALFFFWLFKRRSSAAAGMNKELERLHLLQELETQFLSISTQPAVWLTNHANFDAKVVYEFSLALTTDISWHANRHIQTSWHMGDRLVEITQQHDLLTANTLDQILFWFRRLDLAVAGDLIKVEDLYSFWRQILPFAIDNRYQFLVHYFDDLHGDEDNIKAVRQVLIGVIRYCQQQKLSSPLSFINGRLDPVLFEHLPKKIKNGLEAAKPRQDDRQDPLVMEDDNSLIQPPKTPRQDPVIGTVANAPIRQRRKEPTVSFEDIEVGKQQPE